MGVLDGAVGSNDDDNDNFIIYGLWNNEVLPYEICFRLRVSGH